VRACGEYFKPPTRTLRTLEGIFQNGQFIGLDVAFDQFVDAIRGDNFRPVTEQAAEMVNRLGVSASKDSPEWNELCRALLRTHLEVYRVELERARGDELATAKTPLNPMLADAFEVGLTKPMPSPSRADRARQETVNGEWSLEEACDRFIAAHVNGAWTAETETQHRALHLGHVQAMGGAGERR
jgi:hypothetical protein